MTAEAKVLVKARRIPFGWTTKLAFVDVGAMRHRYNGRRKYARTLTVAVAKAVDPWMRREWPGDTREYVGTIAADGTINLVEGGD